MPRVFKTVGVSLPPELVEYVQDLSTSLYHGNRSLIFREGLYFVLWNLEEALEEAIKLLEEGKDLEEEAIKRDGPISYYLLSIGYSGKSKEELEDLLKRTKAIKKRLERELYYV